MRYPTVLKWLVGATLSLSVVLCRAADLSVRPVPVFENLSASVEVFPLSIEVANRGPDAVGTLTVRSGSYVMSYPVELPRGSIKQIAVFPRQIGYGGALQVNLATDQGTVAKTFDEMNWSQGATLPVAMIGDNPGLMAFLASTDANQGPISVGDCYCLPEAAPDRPVGYRSIQSVVLGEGSERLSDSQVRALKLWVLAGGHLVFVGGASSPVCDDKRWQDVIPVHDLRPVQVPGSAALALGGSAIGQGFPILAGSLSDGAYVPKRGTSTATPHPLLVTKSIGLGQTTFMAFNLFEEPFLRWDARRSTLLQAAQPMSRAAQFYRDLAMPARSYDDYSYSVAAPPAVYEDKDISEPMGPRPVSRQPRGSYGESPFRAKLPPTERVLLVLAGFFVAVVPINFLVLKKLKRGELAWVTAPLLSLGFAAYFLAAAGSLYSAKLSQATGGLLIGGEGQKEAYFVGQTQMFFPRGGSYDLGLRRVDEIAERGNEYEYGYRTRTNFLQELAATDIGAIKADRLNVGNLSFREFEFRQILPAGKWFTLSGRFKKTGKTVSFAGKLTNSSPFTLTHVSIVAVPFFADLPGQLAPGQTVAVIGSFTPSGPQKTNNAVLKGLRLEAVVQGLKPGPQIGEIVEEGSMIILSYSFNLPLPEDLR